MINIFIGGSRKISKLNKIILNKLDEIMNNGNFIFIGDANGVDKSVQKYLFLKAYHNVIVFCVDECRNNIGRWEVRHIKPVKKNKDINYYARKDLEMIDLSNYGLIIWNEESKGTYNNILRLLKQNKMFYLYSTKKKEINTITSFSEIDRFLSKIDDGPLFTNVIAM